MNLELLPLPSETPKDDIRELTADEIKQYVEPGYIAAGERLPDSSVATFVGVIREGRVVASIGLQIKLHAQPLQIEPGHGSVLPALIKKVEDIILQRCGPQWVYLFAPAGKLTQIAQTMGMGLEPWCVLSKLVMPEAPSKGPIEIVMPLTEADEETQDVVRSQ